MADKVKEFATAWHRDAYVEAVGREVAALEQRVEQVAAADGDPLAEHLKTELESSIKAAKAELARVKKTSQPKDEEA